MKKNQLLRGLNPIALFLVLLLTMISCRTSQDEIAKDGIATIQVNIKGLEYLTDKDGDNALAATNLGVSKTSSTNTISEIVGRVHLKDDYYLIATTSPMDDPSPVRTKALASTTAVNPGVPEKLPSGIKYRVVVYDKNNNLVVQKVYTVGTKLPDDSTALQLNGGTYKFVVYSFNTKSAPPVVDSGNPLVSPPANTDLLYYAKDLTVNGNTTNNLDVVLIHQYSAVKLVFQSGIGNISSISGVRISPNLVNNQINLISGDIKYDTNISSVEPYTSTFTGYDTNNVSSDPVILGTTGTVSATVSVNSITINGEILQKFRYNFKLKPRNSLKLTLTVVKYPTITNVVQIASGYYHTLALTKSGDVYGTGHIDYGELGPGLYDYSERSGISQLYVTKFFKLTTGIPDGVQKIAASDGSSYLLSNNGSLYTAGINGFGQLGNGNTTDTSRDGNFSKILFPGGIIIKDIAAGVNQAYILTTAGKVLATGLNDYGQLGVGDSTNRNNFIPVTGIPDGEKVEQIAAGNWHVVVRTASGKIYASGYDGYGQLAGTGSRNSFAQIPFTAGTIRSIGAGYNTTFIVTTDGRLYGTGQDYNGELGLGGNTSYQLKLTRINLNDVKEVHSYNKHSIAITNSGVLYVAGYNANGQLGLGDTATRYYFTQVTSIVDPIKFALDGPGAFHTILVGQSDVYGAGSNYYATMGINNFVYINPKFISLPLKSIQ